jgi:hypothetical protein
VRVEDAGVLAVHAVAVVGQVALLVRLDLGDDHRRDPTRVALVLDPVPDTHESAGHVRDRVEVGPVGRDDGLGSHVEGQTLAVLDGVGLRLGVVADHGREVPPGIVGEAVAPGHVGARLPDHRCLYLCHAHALLLVGIDHRR